MKGVVFTEFLDMVEGQFGPGMPEKLIERCELESGGVYTAVGTYEFTEMAALVGALSRELGTPVSELLFAYGEHLFGRFVERFPQFFEDGGGSFDFLKGIEDRIHSEVRKLYPDAELPTFEVMHTSDGELVMDYDSCRPLGDLAEGLITGCLKHFDDRVVMCREDLPAETGGRARFTLRALTSADTAGNTDDGPVGEESIADTDGEVAEVGLLRRKLARERAAREAAEQLLDGKSRELFEANRSLQTLNNSLETRVRERTRELALARDQALAGNRSKSAFLANMSHELRTPLNAIIGYSEMMMADADDRGDEEAMADLGRVVGAGRHLLGMIEDILDLAKVEVGRLKLNAVPVNLAVLLEEAAEEIKPEMDKGGNALVVNCQPSVGVIASDAARLRKCIMNLLSNAAKFTENGTVTLSAEKVYGYTWSTIEISVSDTGAGMDQENIDALFDPFAQGEDPITKKHGGSGLGLAIVQKMVRALGGDVRGESQPDVGTCFTLSLPCTDVVTGAPDSGADKGEVAPEPLRSGTEG